MSVFFTVSTKERSDDVLSTKEVSGTCACPTLCDKMKWIPVDNNL